MLRGVVVQLLREGLEVLGGRLSVGRGDGGLLLVMLNLGSRGRGSILLLRRRRRGSTVLLLSLRRRRRCTTISLLLLLSLRRR